MSSEFKLHIAECIAFGGFQQSHTPCIYVCLCVAMSTIVTSATWCIRLISQSNCLHCTQTTAQTAAYGTVRFRHLHMCIQYWYAHDMWNNRITYIYNCFKSFEQIPSSDYSNWLSFVFVFFSMLLVSSMCWLGCLGVDHYVQFKTKTRFAAYSLRWPMPRTQHWSVVKRAALEVPQTFKMQRSPNSTPTPQRNHVYACFNWCFTLNDFLRVFFLFLNNKFFKFIFF